MIDVIFLKDNFSDIIADVMSIFNVGWHKTENQSECDTMACIKNK